MRITSVEFETQDLLRAESFYGSLLGLPTTHENGTLTIRAGASTLALHKGPVGPGKQHLAFTIPRLIFDSAKKWTAERVSLLRDADGRDEFETAPYWNGHSLYFADPDGNILEFIIRRDIPDDRVGPFRAEHIQCISEVGIPARNVPHIAAHAQSAFGIDAYGTGAPTFQPVGNVDGLLILVTPGRHWFPTATPSGARRLLVNIDSRTKGTLEPQPGIHYPLECSTSMKWETSKINTTVPTDLATSALTIPLSENLPVDLQGGVHFWTSLKVGTNGDCTQPWAPVPQ